MAVNICPVWAVLVSRVSDMRTNMNVPEGTVIGALSFVPPRFAFEPWSVYAGIPIHRVGARNRTAVEDQARKLRAQLDALTRQV